jgi:murein DD-endopeptidase MepM/ murein hydrolase activator NlpD
MMSKENTLKFLFKVTYKIQNIFSVFIKSFSSVQHRWKAHKGTDYAANAETPITVTAEEL